MARVLLLAGPGPSTWIVANALASEHAELTVVIEQPEPRAVFLRRRVRKLGLPAVAGQVLFQAWGKIGARLAAARVREIMAGAGIAPIASRSSRDRMRVPFTTTTSGSAVVIRNTTEGSLAFATC